MIIKKLITILGFKFVWLSSVLGEIYINSYFGFIVGIIFILFFILSENNKIFSIKLILLFSLIGYFFDTFLSFFELYKINAQINFLCLPLWFLTLWPSFCCLLINVLSFLKNRKILATALGAIFGPLSYYAGVSVGISSFSNILVFLLISFYWSLMMFYYSKF